MEGCAAQVIENGKFNTEMKELDLITVQLTYLLKTMLQEHIKRDHYKQRPHACVVCGKTFYKKYDLKIHVR